MVKSHRKKMKHSHVSHDSKQTHSTKNNSLNLGKVWAMTAIVFGALLIISIFTQGFTDINANFVKTNNEEYVNQVSDPLDVEIYVMSQCPYGVQAEDSLFEAIQDLGQENFNLQVDFIVTPLEDKTFQSLHGQNEVVGNILQLCAQSVDENKYLDFILCMNKGYTTIPSGWESCAEEAGINSQAIQSCLEGNQGVELLTASALRAQEAGASASPTIYVDNKAYTGGRTSLDFKRAFCLAFGEEQPSTCKDVPKPVEVSLTVITANDCPTCDTSQIIAASETLFPGVVVKEIQVDSKEGKELVEKLDVEIIPAYIFDEAVIKTESWKQPQFDLNFDVLDNKYYKLKDEVTGATYFISEEARTQRLENMGISLGDNKPQIDFFLMSYCPYGNIAEEIIEEVYNTLKDKAEFKPHYIYYPNYEGGGSNYCIDENNIFCSMHGAVEARQNIREQCVLEKYGIDAWFEFAREMNTACTYTNADTCFKDVANGLGYDVDAISLCESEKGETFAAQDIEFMSVFGAQGSPAIYIDGETYTGSRDANSILSAMCNAFEDVPAECDVVINSNVETVTSATC